MCCCVVVFLSGRFGSVQGDITVCLLWCLLQNRSCKHEVCRPGCLQSQTRAPMCSQVNCSRPFYFKSWLNLSGDEALLCSGAERSCLWFLRDDKTLQQSVTPGENTLVTAAVNRGGLHAQTQVAAALSASTAASEGCLVLRWTLNLQQQRRPAARRRGRGNMLRASKKKHSPTDSPLLTTISVTST